MEIKVTIEGNPMTGKTLLASLIGDLVRKHGGEINWQSPDNPKFIEENDEQSAFFLKGTTVYIYEQITQ